MSINQPSSQNQMNEETAPVWVGVSIFVGLVIVFYIWHQQIVSFLFYVKYRELQWIAHFEPRYILLSNWVQQVPFSSVTAEQLGELSVIVGQALRIVLIPATLLLAVFLYFFGPGKNFKEVQTTVTLHRHLLPSFPATTPVTGLELQKKALAEGPWSMSVAPKDFLEKNQLLVASKEKPVIDRVRTKMLFVQQLGRRWESVDELKPHEKAVLAVLSTFANYHRDEAEKLANQISSSAKGEHIDPKKLNYTGVDEYLNRYASTEKVKKIIDGHAYVNTVFSSLLISARTSGIVPTASFLWLKPVDRPLWYALNNVGRQTSFAEAAAVRSHWLVEKALGRAIVWPMVDQAVDSFDYYFESVVINLAAQHAVAGDTHWDVAEEAQQQPEENETVLSDAPVEEEHQAQGKEDAT